jgi:serine/threonine protein kinase
MVQEFVTLGRYQLLSRLAVGGMAEVYLARQGELSGFKTLVVVKKVLPHLAVKPDFIAMFLDEARIASMLDHPNVVRITEVGRTENEYFLAMELVQGKPLASILQQSERAKTPLPHNLGALIVANAAAGLHHAHQLTDASGNLLGLVHRDVSPQNIMVSFEGSVKVIDFGIARALGRLGDTNSGSLKGKLGYMAPEQARGEPVDARADIFSLGVVLWECVAGRRLFLRENELATLRAVVYEPIPSVSKYAEVDPALDAIIGGPSPATSTSAFKAPKRCALPLRNGCSRQGEPAPTISRL